MSIVLAIDPGPVESAFVVLNTATGGIRNAGKSENRVLLGNVRGRSPEVEHIVIEQVASYGMSVGAEVFETVYWSGRFAEAGEHRHALVDRMPRVAVKVAICRDSRAKDGNIRQAIIDRYGGQSAIGTKKSPGPLYGIKGDMWQALALGIAWGETQA